MRISDWSSDVCSSDLVAIGQRAYVDGPIVQPVAVIEDSRCPATVRCVWAGQVRVKMLWIRPTGENQPFEVTLGKRTPLADGSILLQSVRPAKQAAAGIRPEDYRFSFRFSGRSAEHTSELQSLMRLSSAVLCLKK